MTFNSTCRDGSDTLCCSLLNVSFARDPTTANWNPTLRMVVVYGVAGFAFTTPLASNGTSNAKVNFLTTDIGATERKTIV